MSERAVASAKERMMRWAKANPWCDTQGISFDEWEQLAEAALDQLPPQAYIYREA